MLTQQQRLARCNGIGGSDAAAIVGESKFKTPLDVYLEKIGEAQPDEESQAMYFGNKMEKIVVEVYEERTGNRCITEEETKIHGAHEWMIANIDRSIIGADIILECKNVGLRSEGWGEEGTDDFPREYLLQCAHYAAVCNVSQVDLAVIIGGQDFRLYHYYRDGKLEDALIEIEKNFWYNHVLKKIPPEPRTLEDLRILYPVDNNSEIMAGKYKDTMIVDYLKLITESKEKIKALEQSVDEGKAEIMKFMKDATFLKSADDARVLATWKTQATTRFDVTRLKENNPEIYKQFLKTSLSRVFRVKGETNEK
jgi:putative phage-type endonuclease